MLYWFESTCLFLKEEEKFSDMLLINAILCLPVYPCIPPNVSTYCFPRNSVFLKRCEVTTPLSIQVMVTNVTSLLKTVKAVQDEHTRGTRALEATIEAIGQEIRVSEVDR
jgi:hypothetical protein